MGACRMLTTTAPATTTIDPTVFLPGPEPGAALAWACVLSCGTRPPARPSGNVPDRAELIPLYLDRNQFHLGALSERLEQNVRVRDRALLQPKTPDRRGRGLSIACYGRAPPPRGLLARSPAFFLNLPAEYASVPPTWPAGIWNLPCTRNAHMHRTDRTCGRMGPR